MAPCKEVKIREKENQQRFVSFIWIQDFSFSRIILINRMMRNRKKNICGYGQLEAMRRKGNYRKYILYQPGNSLPGDAIEQVFSKNLLECTIIQAWMLSWLVFPLCSCNSSAATHHNTLPESHFQAKYLHWFWRRQARSAKRNRTFSIGAN